MIGELTTLFSVMAFVTNFIVVGAMVSNYDKMNTMLVCILNLLLLDGIFAAIGALFRGPGIINPHFYEMHVVTRTLCPTLPFFITWVPPLCSIAILIITIDRYIAIRHPLNYSSILTRQRALILISFTWLFQLVKFIVELLLDTLTNVISVDFDPTLKRCEFSSKKYVFLIQLIYYFIPFLIMCGLYLGIFIEVWSSIRYRNKRQPGVHIKKDTSLRKKFKIILTLSLVTVGFFVAWFPYFYNMTELVVFGVSRKGFKGTIVMFYFNLLWDSVVYAIRTPLIYKLLLRTSVFRWCFRNATRMQVYVSKWSSQGAASSGVQGGIQGGVQLR